MLAPERETGLRARPSFWNSYFSRGNQHSFSLSRARLQMNWRHNKRDRKKFPCPILEPGSRKSLASHAKLKSGTLHMPHLLRSENWSNFNTPGPSAESCPQTAFTFQKPQPQIIQPPIPFRIWNPQNPKHKPQIIKNKHSPKPRSSTTTFTTKILQPKQNFNTHPSSRYCRSKKNRTHSKTKQNSHTNSTQEPTIRNPQRSSQLQIKPNFFCNKPTSVKQNPSQNCIYWAWSGNKSLQSQSASS